LCNEAQPKLPHRTVHRYIECYCGIAHFPIVDFIKQHFGVEDGDDGAAISAKIDQDVNGLGQELRMASPYIKYLLSVDSKEDAIPEMDVQQRRVKLIEAIRTVILKAAEHKPLVLVVEDLHWVDSTSEEIMRDLADGITDARVLLLLTYRPVYQNPFGERTYFTSLALQALSTHESTRFTQGMLATSTLPEALSSLIAQKAEGNPLFAEEVIKSLLETGALTRSDNRYLLGQSDEEVDVPDTVQDVIMARLDRLEEAPKRALQLASVIGREFAVQLLDRISDLQARLDPLLRELQVLEFIRERSTYPEVAYMFKHALTHDVAYNSLLVQRRQILHRVVAEAIEELYTDRLTEFYEMLAYHYEHAQVWDKALSYLVEAGKKAEQAYANQEALIHYDRALDICAHSGASLELDALLTIHSGKGSILFCQSEWLASNEAYQVALDYARRLDDQSKEAAILNRIGVNFLWDHQFEQALDYAEQTKNLALAVDAQKSIAGSLWLTGKVHFMTSELEQGARCFTEALEISRESGDRFFEGYTLMELGLLDNWRGAYPQSRQLLEQGLAIGRTHNLVYIQCWLLFCLGIASCGKGDYDEARTSLQEGIKLSGQIGDKAAKPRGLNSLGWLYTELYNLETAIRYNQESAELAYEVGEPELIAYAEINLAVDYLYLGELEQAHRHLDNAGSAAGTSQKWGDEWMKWRYRQYLHHTQGELWLRQDNAEAALQCAESCLELADANSTKKNMVKGWRLKGQALLAQGHADEAEQAIQRALSIAQEIGNPPQLWQTYQALGELCTSREDLVAAGIAYRNSLDTIEDVAARLQDDQIKSTFLSAQPVQQIRDSVARLKGF
jgi:predicted ATPase|tara:strand:+ start:26439 stop:28976 length:2538 start_codon:yes stop_codon:yes gene_type:complete